MSSVSCVFLSIGEILGYTRAAGLRLTMETNGVLCTESIAQAIACGKDPFVSVSLDGSNGETHEWLRGVPGCFQASAQGIRHLAKAGLKPQVIMTVMRRNQDQIEGMVRLAESLGAGSVKFNILQPTGRGEHMHQAGEVLSVEELLELGHRVENIVSRSTSLRLIFHYPAAFRPLGKIFGDNGSGCGVCGILGILGVLANGSYALCGIGETVPELVFGHAARDDLKDVWEDNPVLEELRQGLPRRLEGVCGECVLKGRCLGSCLAQNYYLSHSLWAPFWFCDGARQRGLFPETRRRPQNPLRPLNSEGS